MPPLLKGFHPGYERNGVYTVEAVFAHLGSGWAMFDGDVIPVISLRYRTFARSVVCVSCGIVGTYFAKERSARVVKPQRLVTKVNGVREITVVPPDVPYKATSSTWHFNLYAILEDGREILMTKDHITPRSRGGADHLNNLQTMCMPCNSHKGDRAFQPRLPFDAALSSVEGLASNS